MVIPYYSGGDLLDYINLHLEAHKRISDAKVHEIMMAIVSALEYCHSRGVAHTDISPEQIWFDDNGVPFLGDLDPIFVPPTAAAAAASSGSTILTSTTTATIAFTRRHGKSSYMAPEMVMKPTSVNPFAADVFSLGATLFTARCARYLLEQVDVYDTNALKARPHFRRLVGSTNGSSSLVQMMASMHRINLSEEFKELVAGMTHGDYSRRMTLKEVMYHPWFNRCPTPVSSPPTPTPVGTHTSTSITTTTSPISSYYHHFQQRPAAAYAPTTGFINSHSPTKAFTLQEMFQQHANHIMATS